MDRRPPGHPRPDHRAGRLNAVPALPRVRLDGYGEDDLDLERRLNEPEMRAFLSPSESDEKVVARHRKYLGLAVERVGQMFRITSLTTGDVVGSIGYWEREWQGETVYETGWGILPEFWGHGYASAAAVAVVAAAAARGTHLSIHAYPKIAHAASNAVCRKAGFTLLGECDFEYPKGTQIRCNDWSHPL
ncbi:MAG: acetyltransferase, ribosomal protein N-acetylase [Actinomycetia bacterium]|nr:acetyltransferase, ribosomal protein N-acetylase [Actinomycetes bacterium]